MAVGWKERLIRWSSEHFQMHSLNKIDFQSKADHPRVWNCEFGYACV